MASDAGLSSRHSTESHSRRLQRTPTFADYLRVFSYATRWDFLIYAIASMASIGAGITLPLMNVVLGKLVSQFTQYFRTTSTMPRGDFERLLDQQALYIMALFIGRWGLSAINKYCFRMIGIRLSSAVRLHYLQSLFAQPIHAIDSMPPGAPATAITTTSNTLQLGISERLGTFLQYNSTIWAALIIAFVWSWDLALVTSSMLLYMMVVLAVAVPLIVKGQTAMAKADAQATAVASEAIEGIRLVMACNAQRRIVSLYKGWVRDALEQGQKLAPVVGGHLGLVYFGVFGAFALAFWYGVQRYIVGAISDAGVVMVVLMSVMMILTSLERVSTPLMAVSKATVAACEFFTVIDAPQPVSGSLKPDVSSEDIEFEDVTFEYPSRPGARVLSELSLRIRMGQTTALVGPSGSGKSTVVGLLERWYSLRGHYVLPKVIEAQPPKESDDEKNCQPNKDSEISTESSTEPSLSGSIKIGGYNLEDLDLAWWRAQIGLVQQEPFLFNDTIFGNVANGLTGTQWEDEPEARKRELVRAACEEAYAHEFIRRLPDGYDTKVGDGGARLSGGQKQRLAIARCIVKQPRIIILDEATSALDSKSEKMVQAALNRATRSRTTIVIAHRLSTIQKADNIIVLQNGRAVEQGTHQSLMTNASGVYGALVRAQALRLSGSDGTELDTPALESNGRLDEMLSDDDPVSHQAHADDAHQANGTEKSQSPLEIFGRLLHQQRDQWPFFLGTILSSMGVAAATPIQAWIFSKVLGLFLLAGDELATKADFWALMWFVLAVGVALAYLLSGWSSMHLQHLVGASYKAQYLTDILYQGASFFDKDGNSHGTLTSHIAGDVKQLEELLGLNLTFFLSGLFQLIGCIIVALIFGRKLGLVALFVTMPIMLASGYWRFRHDLQFDQMNSAVFAESSQFATEAIGAMRTVSALGMETSINRRYQRRLDGHVRAANQKAQWTCALFGFSDSASLGCQALVFWYGGRLLASNEYSMEAFFLCFMAIIQGAESASQCLSIAPSASQAKTAADRILRAQESAHVEHDGSCGDGGIPETDGGIEIELQGVHFKYPTRDTPIFQSLSINFKKGQYVALVGASGSGKTTIISLLERFYDLEPHQGTILCNGVDISSLDVYAYRRNLALVAQEPTMFRGTVRDNVLFGMADPGSISEERVHQVCRDAFIHDFIISLPEGYDTDIGAKGVSLSGGQKQRVALARALMRDPKILLLDEATSALDSESENMVQAALEKARSGRTIVAVAHRLSTIQNADAIFVFDEGKVAENGTHTELVQKRGIYWEMCHSQSLAQ